MNKKALLTVGVVTLSAAAPWFKAHAACVSSGITLNVNRDLLFGLNAVGATPGTVRIKMNGNQVAQGGVTALGGVSQAGRVRIRCPGGSFETVQVSISPNVATMSNGADAVLSVDDFRVGGNGKSFQETVTLNRRGRKNVKIGATMNVGAFQTGGAYTGTYTISVIVP